MSTTKQRPLTASLHTVTAVSRVASSAAVRATFSSQMDGRYAADLVVRALEILGYDSEAANLSKLIIVRDEQNAPELIAKCIAATAKALA